MGIFSRGRDARAGIREWECGRRAVRLRYGTTFISTIVKWLTLFFRFMASNSGETTSRQEAENVINLAPICPQASACSSLRGPSAPARSHEWASRYAAGGGGGGLGGLGSGGFGGLGGSICNSCSAMAGPAAA